MIVMSETVHCAWPLLLHASSKASTNCMRRVLHFVFGPKEPPGAPPDYLWAQGICVRPAWHRDDEFSGLNLPLSN